MPDEWNEVAKYIYKNQKFFCGVSLLPFSGDKDYKPAPFTAVHTSREIVREYGDAAIWCSGLIELALGAFNDDLWDACDTLLDNEYKPLNGFTSSDLEEAFRKRSFYEKARKFATKYFEGDMRRLTYCMKDVFNWKLYKDLESNFKPIDYTQMKEAEDNTAPEQELSCVGGACLI